MISAFGVDHGLVSKAEQLYTQTYRKKTQKERRVERARNVVGGSLIGGATIATKMPKGAKRAVVPLGVGVGALSGARKKINPYEEHSMVPEKGK
jgi:hypothetical protein